MKLQLSKKKISIISICLVFAILFSLIINSLGYFSDTIFASTDGTAGTVQVSLDDSGINLLNPYGQDILNPGDARPVVFTVTNDGNKSVDTEVVITLTSSEPMSNNDFSNVYIPLSLDVDDIINKNSYADYNLYYGNVYHSEYELYWADDIVFKEDYGYYPKAPKAGIINGMMWDICHKVDERYINTAHTQIKYILDGDVLSGNMSLDEQEQEYVKVEGKKEPSATPYINKLSEDTYTIEYGDLSEYDENLGECYYMLVNTDSEEFMLGDLAIPNTHIVDGSEITIDYIVFEGFDGVIGTMADSIYIGDNVQGIVSVYTCSSPADISYMDRADLEEIDFYNFYDNYEDLVGSDNSEPKDEALKEVITATEYEALSDEEKANYELAPSSKTYEFVLLFDPNSSNRFQNSSVSIQIEVRAKQHRNTEAGWELVAESTNASIDTSVFTVERNEFGKVALTGIKNGADLTNVVIPEGVQVIPDEFFIGTQEIQTVTLPSTIEEIGEWAFENCSNLNTINFPEGLEAIGEYAFRFCTSLTSVDLPESLEYIGEYAFSDCSNLTSINFPEGLKHIGKYAFKTCNKLTTIVIPDSVEYIDNYAFYTSSKVVTTVYTNKQLDAKTYFGNRIVTFLPYEEYGA